MSRMVLFVLLLCASTACRDPASTLVFDTEGKLSGPGAPDRLTCTTDSECVITDVPSNRPPSPPPRLLGCCPTGGFDPTTRAFHDWMTALQSRRCPTDRSGCPALPAPAMPAPCMHEARCVARQCSNACGPAASAP